MATIKKGDAFGVTGYIAHLSQAEINLLRAVMGNFIQEGEARTLAYNLYTAVYPFTKKWAAIAIGDEEEVWKLNSEWTSEGAYKDNLGD